MSLGRLTLAQFRSWPHLDLDLDTRPVVLAGPNGAGKTNVLEAASMLAPGRGMRGAAPSTVRAQLSRIYAKAGVSGQSMLIGLVVDELLDLAPQLSTPG